MNGGKMLGVPNVVANLRKLADMFPDKVASALYMEAQLILTEAKRRCPVAHDGGQLRASGRVQAPVREGKNISVTISFGPMAYAIAVHEHLSEHSPPSWIKAEMLGHGIDWTTPGTGPKFLESVINEAMPDMARRIADRINLTDMRL